MNRYMRIFRKLIRVHAFGHFVFAVIAIYGALHFGSWYAILPFASGLIMDAAFSYIKYLTGR